MLTYKEVGQILIDELGLEDYEFSVDHIGRSGKDEKATGLYFFRKTESYSCRLEVGSGRGSKTGFGIGVVHFARVSINAIESIYNEIIDSSYYFSAGLNQFGPNQRTVKFRSEPQPEFRKYWNYREYELIEHAVPLLRKTFADLEKKVESSSTPEAIYEKMESFDSYMAMDSYVGGFTPIRRLILKAWVKDPEFHNYARYMIKLNENFAKKGDPQMALLLESIKKTYKHTTKLYNDPTHEHMPVEYKNAIYYYDHL
jgi:hypothetical protein